MPAAIHKERRSAMIFEVDHLDYVLTSHMPYFAAAARQFNCHILVRKTGRASLSWVGKRGYTGKRADMKAKTADRNTGARPVAGLVCSPTLRPDAFTKERLESALKIWNDPANHIAQLVSLPNNPRGFDHQQPPRGCSTPYLLQTAPNHPHYGCVALVEAGLLTPRYIHGDYDLYAIIPAGKAFDPGNATQQALRNRTGSSMSPESLGLQRRLNPVLTDDLVGPLSFRVSNFINVSICGSNPDSLGALMVNHGEAVNIGEKGTTFEPVLAIMPGPIGSRITRVRNTREDHEAFYRTA
jgi:hypothetical protein